MKNLIAAVLVTFTAVDVHAEIWVEKNHADFADGWEYYYPPGDTATVWNPSQLRNWHLGSVIWSPIDGGLRIIGKDWDLDDNGWLDVVLTWEYENKVHIYWNSPSGFDTTNKTVLSGLYDQPQGLSLADIDGDGYEDIVIASYLSGSWNPRIHIFEGNASGYSPTPDDSIIHSPRGIQHPYPVDIDNDGNIDIVVGGEHRIYVYFGPGPFCAQLPGDSICFGSGFSTRLTLTDLDYDTHLDISSSFSNGAQDLHIYKGFGFDSADTLAIPTGNWDHSVADINKDGFLDIYVNHHYGPLSDMIYWGSGSGFTGPCLIDGNGPGGCSIEDINGDGELDIATNQTYIDSGFIMWGPNHTSYVTLPSASTDAVATYVADFDNNGQKDVLFSGTGGPSYLYWNNSGFSSMDRFTFPDHSNDGIFEDLGNLWDRSNRERYLSSVFSAQDTVRVDSVRWWGDFLGIDIEVWMRGAQDTSSWNPWVRLTNGGTDNSLVKVRHLQYRCIFHLDYKFTSVFSFDSIKVYCDTLPIGVEAEPSDYELRIDTHRNPLNGATCLSFSLPEPGKVNLVVYNLAGNVVKTLVRNREYLPGQHSQLWNTIDSHNRKVASGTYFCVFEFTSDNKRKSSITKKLVVAR